MCPGQPEHFETELREDIGKLGSDRAAAKHRDASAARQRQLEKRIGCQDLRTAEAQVLWDERSRPGCDDCVAGLEHPVRY